MLARFPGFIFAFTGPYRHLGSPEKLADKRVTFLKLLHYHAFRPFVLPYTLVEIGVELQSQGENRFDALHFQRGKELFLQQLYAFGPVLVGDIRRYRGDSALEVVQHRENGGESAGTGELAELEPILLGAAFKIDKVGLGALPAVKVLLALFLFFSEGLFQAGLFRSRFLGDRFLV